MDTELKQKIVLYHGGTTIVRQPKVIRAARALDFGAAFYCTSDFEQAKKWSLRKGRFVDRTLYRPTVRNCVIINCANLTQDFSCQARRQVPLILAVSMGSANEA
jgi:hypothetical protein